MKEAKKLYTRDERIDILIKRDGPNCFYPDCGKPFKSREDITFDHWLPRSAGGTWDIENLRMMHKRCNAIKGDLIPNEDGTLPARSTKVSTSKTLKRSERPIICNLCESGRILLPGEECPLCGSGPQPARFPGALQKTPKECDHSTHHCWMCTIGFIERKTAITRILEGP